MALSERLPDIPYIRLSKIERGEVFARAEEINGIAAALGIPALDLLIDLADPEFDIASWAKPFQDPRPPSDDEEQFAVMLAAGLRQLRSADATLTMARLEKDFALPPVILSRLENAHRTIDRWNATVLSSVCRLFGVTDEQALRATVAERYRRGELNAFVGRITDPETRTARSLDRITALRTELAAAPPVRRRQGPRRAAAGSPVQAVPPVAAAARPATEQGDPPHAASELPVYGSPLPGGLIAFTRTDGVVDKPHRAGPRAFALRVCRATLGAGLPANAIVVADPDRAPSAGGLAAIRSDAGYRLVTITFDRTGATKGYVVATDLEYDIDELDPADVAPVIAAVFPSEQRFL